MKRRSPRAVGGGVRTLWRALATDLGMALGLTIAIVSWPLRRQIDASLLAATFGAVACFTLGGHGADLLYWRLLRPRVPFLRHHPYLTRLTWWAAAGLPIGLAASFTWTRLRKEVGGPLPFWWGAPLSIFLQCAIHAARAARGRPSLWNEQG